MKKKLLLSYRRAVVTVDRNVKQILRECARRKHCEWSARKGLYLILLLASILLCARSLFRMATDYADLPMTKSSKLWVQSDRWVPSFESLISHYRGVQSGQHINDVQGLYDLAQRRLPELDIGKVQFELLDAYKSHQQDKLDWYEFARKSNHIHIRGSSLSALSYGLGDLYRNDCGIDLLSWASRKETFPQGFSCLHNVKLRKGRFKARVNHRYYLNQVTWSYSMATWGWARWEDELDWMALHGVNLALAHSGQEALWDRVYTKLLSPGTFDREAFFTGSMYLSWQRMGNIQRVGTPMTSELMQAHLKLQHKILWRMGDLGISPILPAFNLYVPQQVAELAVTEQGSSWSGFHHPRYTNLARLHPEDPLASELSARFLDVQLREFEAELARIPTRYYSCDLYNEMEPGMAVGTAFHAVFDPVHRLDPTAIFVVQMWFLAHGGADWPLEKAKEFLDAVPRDRVLYLDLHGEKRPQWKRLAPVLEDARLVWTYLHNFGGNRGLAGEMRHVKESINLAIQVGKVQGLGLAMEGIEQNEIVYHHVLDLAWEHNEVVSVETWVRSWARARYRLGTESTQGQESLMEAWTCAFMTVYSRPKDLVGWGNTKCILSLPPRMHVRHRMFQPTDIGYAPAKFQRCATMLARGALHSLPGSAARGVLHYDLIDFGRQVLCDKALVTTSRIERIFRRGFYHESDHNDMLVLAENLDQILDHMQVLLNSHWMWQNSADSVDPSVAGPGELRDLRELYTRWSEHTMALDSYASRLTGDSAQGIHFPRWRVWIKMVLRDGQPSKAAFDRFQEIEDEYIASGKPPARYSHEPPNTPWSSGYLLSVLQDVSNMESHGKPEQLK
mmetsp:Transcript_76/g.260  ORF Transcript_76/g.260 Transcript_76/m.260 type:complete len:846 (-) Transcript_76:33-2570(-)